MRRLDLRSLEEGYENICEIYRDYRVAYVHGRLKPEEKDYQMSIFASGEAQILVSTTVIEVGVNVPNATTMLIENAERFGLSQAPSATRTCRPRRGAELLHTHDQTQDCQGYAPASRTDDGHNQRF